jgi:hypothetical protein
LQIGIGIDNEKFVAARSQRYVVLLVGSRLPAKPVDMREQSRTFEIEKENRVQ